MFGPVVQIAYVVPDPEAAAREWHERHGAGPFFLRHHIPVTDVMHRGHPSSFDHTSAYGWLGGVMIELFTQHDRSPSAVTERFAEGESGNGQSRNYVAADGDLEISVLPSNLDNNRRS